MSTLNSPQIRPFIPYPIQTPRHTHHQPNLKFSPKTLLNPLKNPQTPPPLKSHKTHHSNPNKKPTKPPKQNDDGIPIDDVKILAQFKSRHNHIRVLQISRAAEHPLAGSRLLLLDSPGNIHSISFPFKPFTDTYFDVFATLPPILPSAGGPIAILGFGAGSTARLILELYPDVVVHGWELDPAVLAVGREFLGLEKLERNYKDRLFIYVGNALNASVKNGYSGILVDLFSKGSLVPELQDSGTWEKLARCLMKGGRIMVNVGGSCVEAEDKRRDGKVVIEETLKVMNRVFGDDGVLVLTLGDGRREDSSVALVGDLPDHDAWKNVLSPRLRRYVDLWRTYGC